MSDALFSTLWCCGYELRHVGSGRDWEYDDGATRIRLSGHSRLKANWVGTVALFQGLQWQPIVDAAPLIAASPGSASGELERLARPRLQALGKLLAWAQQSELSELERRVEELESACLRLREAVDTGRYPLP